MLNTAILQGRLTAAPELCQTPQGVLVCRFSVAVARDYDREQTDFIDITAWRKTAEFVCKYFQKGSAILVEGRIQTGSYVDKETGKNRRTFEVVANNVHFGESKVQKAESETGYGGDYTQLDADTSDEDSPF